MHRKNERPRGAIPAHHEGHSSGWGESPEEESQETLFRVLEENRSYLMEHESKEILEGIGVRTTGFLVAGSEDEAVALSENIGFPVVLKIASSDVVHKTDAGGVRLNLVNTRQVRTAYREIIDTFRYQHINGVAVQEMARPGLEAIIGVARDPSFGPVIMFGLGGIFVEVMKDVSFRVLPITERDADEMIEEIKGYALLAGYRGQAIDIPALKQLLIKISELITRNPEIREIDLNPVFLYPEGYKVADARMFVGAPPCTGDRTPRGEPDLRDFFYPTSIAVLGATDVEGKLGYNVFRNLVFHGFPGKLHPINPGKESVLGVRAHRSILDVDDPVDLAIIIVPARAVPRAIEDCCAKGIRYIVVETAGFAEIGDGGEEAQARIREIIRERGCRILGPNCSGVINTHHNMVQSLGVLGELERGNVGLVAQAGVYAAGILTGLRSVLDFGIVATIGNKMDIGETDILEYLGKDDHIDVIAMYMEDVKSGRRFVDVSRRVTAKKPVIVLKSGRTEAGKKAVSSHTASLAGDEEVNNAAFRQGGIIRARDNEHLFALTRAFSKQPLPKGDGVMVVTYTGSLGVAATDMLYLSNMRLGTLEPHLQKRLKDILPDYLNIQNPVDCSFSMTPDQVKALIEVGTRSNDVHSFIVILQGEMLRAFVDTLKEIDYRGKPIVCCVACKEFMMDDVVKIEKAGIPVYSTSEMAAEVLGEMYHYGLRQRNALADSIARRLPREPLSIDDVPVHLRLISYRDIGLWTDFVKSCSGKSLWLRFLSPFNPTPERARRFCDVDPEEEIAVVAETNGRNPRRLLGIARLIRNRRCEGEVEYALLISDPWQQKRLGSLMSGRCIELARDAGFKTIRSETLQENFPMIRIFRHYNFQFVGKDENMVSLSLNLS